MGGDAPSTGGDLALSPSRSLSLSLSLSLASLSPGDAGGVVDQGGEEWLEVILKEADSECSGGKEDDTADWILPAPPPDEELALSPGKDVASPSTVGGALAPSPGEGSSCSTRIEVSILLSNVAMFTPWYKLVDKMDIPS